MLLSCYSSCQETLSRDFEAKILQGHEFHWNTVHTEPIADFSAAFNAYTLQIQCTKLSSELARGLLLQVESHERASSHEVHSSRSPPSSPYDKHVKHLPQHS